MKSQGRNYRDTALRPRVRGDCYESPRPCPWFLCKHHMLWVFKPSFLRKVSDEELLEIWWGMPESCVLDVADSGEQYGAEIGRIIGVSRERIRQIVSDFGGGGGTALKRIRREARIGHLRGFLDEDLCVR